NYVWFLPHWYTSGWYLKSDDNSNDTCSNEEMKKALVGHMSLSYKYFADNDTIMQEGLVVGEWRKKYNEDVIRSNRTPSEYAGFTYDAVWTYALALDKLFKENVSYAADLRLQPTTDRFVHFINISNFDGVSGRINFTNGTSRHTDVILWQWVKEGKYKQVGKFHSFYSDDNGELDLYQNEMEWPNGKIPNDGSKECPIEAFRVALGEDYTCPVAIFILCALCFGGLTLLLVVVIIIYKRKYEKKLEQMQEYLRGRPIFEMFDGWEIARDKVVINRKLGEGAFGTVYGGECQFETQGWVPVAVKTLKTGSTISEKLDFLSEAEMMKNFNHDNIVRLIGVCTKIEPIYTVMEFMLYGDLKTFLLARRNLVNDKNRGDDDEVSNKRLTSMALDISRGLSYLAEQKYVHRDVACRNCLVNATRTVKLADFGMTRKMYDNNYYRYNKKGMLPVRWMAPESLIDGVFTTMSDIWSYGVLLFEIITFGAFPFQGLSNNQVLERVKAGHTIPIPSGVKPQLESLLRACWNRNARLRPPASQIVEHLSSNPRLIQPCISGPQSSVQMEDAVSIDLKIPDRTRKLSLIQTRLPQVGTSSRKRSMSGNMVMNIPVLTTSLSEDGMISAHSNLDALNLNSVMLEESEMGEDPLLPPAQYVSTRYVSLAHKENHQNRQTTGDYCTTDISRDLWTSVTPV
ncbi:unnamed protein product, partial [Meganyctiphanes norvegica]